MSDKQPEALRLAGALIWERPNVKVATRQDAAKELRRLHEVNAELVKALKTAVAIIGRPDDSGSKFIESILAKATGVEQ